MRRPTAVSVLLLVAGSACLVAGVWTVGGIGWALIVIGVLLFVAELLVPSR